MARPNRIIEVECSVCGKKIMRSAYEVKKYKRFLCGNPACKKQIFKNRIMVKCDWCGVEFGRIPAKIKRNDNNFCCVACEYMFYTGKLKPDRFKQVIVKCDWCGKEHSRVPAHISKYVFCNHSCYAKWLSTNRKGETHACYKGKIKVLCANCNKDIYKYPFEIKEGKKYFCNQSCKQSYFVGENAINWQGGVSKNPYPLQFKQEKFKESVRDLDNRLCKMCGKHESKLSRTLHIHHVDEDKNNLDYENLLSLCASCHVKVGRNIELKEVLKYETFIEDYINNPYSMAI